MPDPPKNLAAVEIQGRSIALEWTAPRNDGGAPIKGYIVERRQGYSTRFIRVGKGTILDTYFRDTAVYEGSDYEYRVCAENEAGQGVSCKPIGPIIAKDPFEIPDSPRCPEVLGVTKNSVTLTWKSPKNDGGSAITNYIIEAKSSFGYNWTTVNIGQKVTTTTFMIPDLVEGNTYEFRVCAENRAGKSEPSEPSQKVVVREPVSGNAPHVIEQLAEVVAKRGESATLQCRITGEPLPEISWLVAISYYWYLNVKVVI